MILDPANSYDAHQGGYNNNERCKTYFNYQQPEIERFHIINLILTHLFCKLDTPYKHR